MTSVINGPHLGDYLSYLAQRIHEKSRQTGRQRETSPEDGWLELAGVNEVAVEKTKLTKR